MRKMVFGGNIFRITFNLAAACLISGCVIAAAHCLTAGAAKRGAAALRDNAMRALVSGAGVFEEIGGRPGWFKVLTDGKVTAYIVPSESRGYGGRMRLLTAVSCDFKVINFAVIESHETPGLGDKTSKAPFTSQFTNKTIESLKLTGGASGGDGVHAVTGATISSAAVTEGVRAAVRAVMELPQSK